MNDAAFARAMHVSPGAVSKWVNSHRGMGLHRIIRIATVLGCTTDWLLGVPGAPKPRSGEVRNAVDLAVKNARAEIRAAILAALEEPAGRGEGRK